MIVIGEKINGTLGNVRRALLDRDRDFISRIAAEQAGAGADYIDVNVGVAEGDEAELMVWALEAVMGATDRPVSLDSSDPEVIEAGLDICGDSRPFVNSVNGEPARLEAVLPLVARYGCPVVALAMDETGIPDTPDRRLEICHEILGASRELGIDAADIYFDPLVLPISTDSDQARVTLDTLARIKAQMPESKTILGLSNVSYGLPRRSHINMAMLAAATACGLDAVLMDPTDRELRIALRAAEALSGRDRYCRDYIEAYRQGLFD